MSTLKKLRAALDARTGVEVVGEQSAFVEPRALNSDEVVHRVTIFVGAAPGIYNAKQLTALLDHLTPIAPLRSSPFTTNTRNPGYMGYGFVEYQEVIGKNITKGTRRIVIGDVDVKLPAGYVGRSKETTTGDTKDLKRHIVVRLFPDVNLATAALDGEGVHHTNDLPGQR